MLGILFRKQSLLCWNLPIYAKRSIKNAYASIDLRMIELIALVLEDGDVAEDGKAVGKALGDKELTMVILREFDGYVLPISGTAFADIDGDIEHSALDTTDEFGLSKRRTLEM